MHNSFLSQRHQSYLSTQALQLATSDVATHFCIRWASSSFGPPNPHTRLRSTRDQSRRHMPKVPRSGYWARKYVAGNNLLCHTTPETNSIYHHYFLLFPNISQITNLTTSISTIKQINENVLMRLRFFYSGRVKS